MAQPLASMEPEDPDTFVGPVTEMPLHLARCGRCGLGTYIRADPSSSDVRPWKRRIKAWAPFWCPNCRGPLRPAEV